MSTLRVKVHLPDNTDMRDISERFAKSVIEQAAHREGCEIKEFTMKRG